MLPRLRRSPVRGRMDARRAAAPDGPDRGPRAGDVAGRRPAGPGELPAGAPQVQHGQVEPGTSEGEAEAVVHRERCKPLTCANVREVSKCPFFDLTPL